MERLPDSLRELAKLPQWVCYRKQWNEQREKFSKIPVDPATGRGAAADDPRTWATYDEAVRQAAARGLDGIGFELGAAGIAGIDIDDCIDEAGALSPFAVSVVAALDSYTEYSPSKRGLHILVYNDSFVGSKNDDLGFEVYCPRCRTQEEKEATFKLDQRKPPEKRKYASVDDVGEIHGGRYLTITGDVYGPEKPIQERSVALKRLAAQYFARKDEPAPQKKAPAFTYGTDESVDDIVKKMLSSSKGIEIKTLFDGDTSAYGGDHSRADQAFCNHLAYWTNGDSGKIDAIFRKSGLMRGKWDEQRGAMTYGQKTIAEALDGFKPYVPPVRTSNGENKRIHDNISNTENIGLQDNTEQPKQEAPRPDNVRDYIYKTMGGELRAFRAFKDRKTGYSNLDQVTSLYPGLYVIGAISSLGKTTFIHQMGDQIAERGDHVLYFSLEQSRLEMVTKGISRETAKLTYKEGFDGALSAIAIRGGKKSEILSETVRNYVKVAENVSIIECNFNTTANYIISYVKEYMKNNDGVKPVVIVDYLQIIRPADPKQATKDAVDANVRALKMLQKEDDLVVMVICSLNRQNYLTPVDFESFKESGGIEYTADVVWGLQLAVMNEDLFNTQNKLKEKRERVKEAKLEVPRRVELVCLKNRYGKSSYSVGFRYYPQYDYFVPETDFDYMD
jgi:replicative DNA helicase